MLWKNYQINLHNRSFNRMILNRRVDKKLSFDKKLNKSNALELESKFQLEIQLKIQIAINKKIKKLKDLNVFHFRAIIDILLKINIKIINKSKEKQYRKFVVIQKLACNKNKKQYKIGMQNNLKKKK